MTRFSTPGSAASFFITPAPAEMFDGMKRHCVAYKTARGGKKRCKKFRTGKGSPTCKGVKKGNLRVGRGMSVHCGK